MRILVIQPIPTEELIAELYSYYGHTVPLDYDKNYIEMNEYAAVFGVTGLFRLLTLR